MRALVKDDIEKAVRFALDEDIGSGDVTTLATVPETAQSAGLIVARESLVLAGVEFAETAFRQLSSSIELHRMAMSERTLRLVNNDVRATTIVTPALGPSLGVAPAGT